MDARSELDVLGGALYVPIMKIIGALLAILGGVTLVFGLALLLASLNEWFSAPKALQKLKDTGIEAQAVLVSLGQPRSGTVSGMFTFDVRGGDSVRAIHNLPVDPPPEIGRTYPIVRDAVYPAKFKLGTRESLDVSAVQKGGRWLALLSVGLIVCGGGLITGAVFLVG